MSDNVSLKPSIIIVGTVLLVVIIMLAALLVNTRRRSGTDNVDWTTSELAERMAGGSSFRLIDVREPWEYASGHIAGAELVPLGSLTDNLGLFKHEEDIAVICRSGNRSSQAVGILRRAGFQRVHNVTGGMMAWEGPVQTGR